MPQEFGQITSEDRPSQAAPSQILRAISPSIINVLLPRFWGRIVWAVMHVMLTAAMHEYLYRLLIEACNRIDKRRPGAQTLRWLLATAGDYRADIENANLQDADLSLMKLDYADLAGVDLRRANLCGTSMQRAHLSRAKLDEAILTSARLIGAEMEGVSARRAKASGLSLANANLSRTTWEGADLEGATLDGAVLQGADLRRANMRRASLIGARLIGCDLRQADLTGADLSRADLIDCDVTATIIREAHVYGVAVWGLVGQPADASNVVITPPDVPQVIVDDLEIAQLLYLLLYDSKVRNVIDAVSSSVVLILGRFTDDRLVVLDSIRTELRCRGYAPVLFNFERPANRDLTETISTLAHLARFIVADITDPRSVPQELERIIPGLPSVPVQPILQSGMEEYAMFEHFRRYPWVLPICEYVAGKEDFDRLTGRTIVDSAEANLGRDR